MQGATKPLLYNFRIPVTWLWCKFYFSFHRPFTRIQSPHYIPAHVVNLASGICLAVLLIFPPILGTIRFKLFFVLRIPSRILLYFPQYFIRTILYGILSLHGCRMIIFVWLVRQFLDAHIFRFFSRNMRDIIILSPFSYPLCTFYQFRLSHAATLLV